MSKSIPNVDWANQLESVIRQFVKKYNIYKIIRSKLDELISKFESVGLKKVSSRIIDN
ncbi:hypothetical protein BV455_00460 [Parageobacillus caldoxylosilyticus]|nr:hypothetical protein BV455_00460 [Parageobacillus caldoxylosilyticus]